MLFGLAIPALAAIMLQAAPAPNIVFFLTDDQDQVLGASFPPTAPDGITPMPKTQALMVEGGVTATKFYIHTPICCPSRAETLTGRYLHNVKRPVAQQQCAAGYNGKTVDGDVRPSAFGCGKQLWPSPPITRMHAHTRTRAGLLHARR